MSLAVDQLELGPIGTNTYSSARRRRATEAASSTRAATPTTIQAALAARDATCAAILVTHGHFDHIVSLADLASRDGRAGLRAGGGARPVRGAGRFTPPGFTVKPSQPGQLARGRRDDRWRPGISFARHERARPLAGAPRLLRRRPSLLRRRPLRRLGGSHRPSERRLERAPGVDRVPPRRVPAGDGRPPGARPGDDARRRAARNPFLADLRALEAPAMSGKIERPARHTRRRAG